MLMASTMALYSSSPPTVWSSQGHKCSSSVSTVEVDSFARPLHSHNSASRHVGGLTSLFGSPNSKYHQTTASASDNCECAYLSRSSGLVKSHSQNDLVHSTSLVDASERRSASINIPFAVSSAKFKERSPVSVLQGPVARSSMHSSPIFSLVALENVSGCGLPPLDPHVERPSRRQISLATDDRRPLCRSVGFEVGNNGGLTGVHSRLPNEVICDQPDVHMDQFLSSRNLMTPLCNDRDSEEAIDLDQFLSSRNLMTALYNDRDSEEAKDLAAARARVSEEAKDLAAARARDSEEAKDLAAARARVSRFSKALNPFVDLVGVRMLTADELLLDAQARHNIFTDSFVVKAFRVAESAHNGQIRRSGDLYLSHCVETALLLAQTGGDSTVVAAGLLHDTLDDSFMDREQLRSYFGVEVELLVEGVSKLSAFSQLARDHETACNPEESDRLRTMFLAMVDVRVVLIKLADRLHNLRTLGALSPSKQLRVADETLEIFAPLASRLGIWSWKAEMEDICFKHLQGKEHAELTSKLAEGWREGVVMSSIQQLEANLRVEGIHFTDLCGRPKNLYSIYKKMKRKGRNIEEICDVRGLRLIVKDEESCYAAMDVVHSQWAHLPKKLKDYIREPKANGYRSLHTVVCADDGFPLEVQIRTMDMHHQAEFGVAAHWRYKEDNSEHSAFLLQKVEWARWVLTWHSELLDTKVRSSPLGADLRPPCPFPFHKDDCPYLSCSIAPGNDDDPLYVIMVEGTNMRVQELPSGSTAADLLEHRMRDTRFSRESGSWPKVNHQFVENFQQKLKMGDLVEISTELDLKGTTVPVQNDESEFRQSLLSTEKPCGKISLEFKREQLRRLYLDDGAYSEEAKRGPPTPQERSQSVVSLS